jgi:hypothetical protein
MTCPSAVLALCLTHCHSWLLLISAVAASSMRLWMGTQPTPLVRHNRVRAVHYSLGNSSILLGILPTESVKDAQSFLLFYTGDCDCQQDCVDGARRRSASVSKAQHNPNIYSIHSWELPPRNVSVGTALRCIWLHSRVLVLQRNSQAATICATYCHNSHAFASSYAGCKLGNSVVDSSTSYSGFEPQRSCELATGLQNMQGCLT